MITVIVYGPQGSGKTTNAEPLRKHFGCSRVVDDWHYGDLICEGDLILTNDDAVLYPRYPRRVDLVRLELALDQVEGADHG